MDNNLETRVESPRISFRVRRQMEALWGAMKSPFEDYSPFELEARRIVRCSLQIYEGIGEKAKILKFPEPKYQQS